MSDAVGRLAAILDADNAPLIQAFEEAERMAECLTEDTCRWPCLAPGEYATEIIVQRQQRYDVSNHDSPVVVELPDHLLVTVRSAGRELWRGDAPTMAIRVASDGASFWLEPPGHHTCFRVIW